jgi:diaminopimelate decarboxylase
MDGFSYRAGQLHCEGVSVAGLARRYGTPLYVYSRAAILNRLKEIQRAFRPAKPLICFSVKSNANQTLLSLLAEAGSGFDIVSGGELFRVLKAGGDPSKIVYAGVGKTLLEIEQAIRAGILMFNAESEEELVAINRVAGTCRRKARVALRVNPDVDARTHAKTTTGKRDNKFGIDLETAAGLFADSARFPNLEISGVHLHLGSPIYSVEPYRSALKKVSGFLRDIRRRGAVVRTLNIGGGYAISYDGKKVIGPNDYAATILPALPKLNVELILEPGRFILGNSAVLVSRVTYVKTGWGGRKFTILDAGMNDLLRPALYDSHHHIWPVSGAPSPLVNGSRAKVKTELTDIVGPICETSDCFAKDRRVPPLKEGDYVAIFSAGAYGMSMSSNYNARPRPCEVLVGGRKSSVIRRRETYEDLVRGE